jgi:hypothetical protein
MESKYFLYISKNKVEMLSKQFRTNALGISEFSPKIAVPGVELGFDLKATQQNNSADMISELVQVVKKLFKDKQIKELTKDKETSTRGYYHDVGIWNTGVIFWNRQYSTGVTAPLIQAYCAVKVINASIILLIGSASNVIGYGLDNKDQLLYGSTNNLAFGGIYGIVQGYVRNDDKVNNKRGSTKPETKNLELDFSFDLAKYCLAELTVFPKTNLDTVFKIYRYYDIRENFELAIKLGLFDTGTLKEEYGNILRFHKLYLGSPIYTAIE